MFLDVLWVINVIQQFTHYSMETITWSELEWKEKLVKSVLPAWPLGEVFDV